MIRPGHLSVLGIVAVVIFAVVGCGGSGPSPSHIGTHPTMAQEKLEREEEDFAQEHKNNWVGCRVAKAMRESGSKSSFMLKGAEKTCRYWREEQRAKRGA